MGEMTLHLKKLIHKVEKINKDVKYEELKKFWNNFYSLKEENRVPINITFTMAFFAKNLGIDLIEHYHNPKKYVEDSLKIIQFQDKEVKDDKVKVEWVCIVCGKTTEIDSPLWIDYPLHLCKKCSEKWEITNHDPGVSIGIREKSEFR